MWVSEVSLENFRNFQSLKVPLENGVNIVYGDNANGKTNLIEAIYFCATGRSGRASHDRELIRFGESESHLQVVTKSGGIAVKPEARAESETAVKPEARADVRRIDVHLFREGKRKGIAIDHIPIKNLSQLFGLLLVVIFTPEDLKIVKAGPGERRTFMDMEICQLSGVYYHALRQYCKALKQRNNLLKAIPKNRSLIDTLEVWDEPLYRYGTQVMSHRAKFIEEIDEIAARIHYSISKERLKIIYRPQINMHLDSNVTAYADPQVGPQFNPNVDLQFSQSINIEQSYKDRLKRNIDRDIAIGSTSAGIHRDDMVLTIDGNDVRTYGSQGQQRTAALSIKLAEIELIKMRTLHTPVLLLDDVLSELDEHRQGFLFEHIGELQTILTCTGIEDILKKTSGNIMKMVKGVIQ